MCVWMAGCQQTGTVDVLMREDDRGRPQPQPQAQTGVHGQAETQRQVGTWFCMPMCCSPGSAPRVKHRRETWEGKKAE